MPLQKGHIILEKIKNNYFLIFTDTSEGLFHFEDRDGNLDLITGFNTVERLAATTKVYTFKNGSLKYVGEFDYLNIRRIKIGLFPERILLSQNDLGVGKINRKSKQDLRLFNLKGRNFKFARIFKFSKDKLKPLTKPEFNADKKKLV